jgi:protein phosphatase
MDNSFRISSGAISDRGLSEKRPQNEDSYLEMEQCGLFAVADGVGGAQAGEVASQMAMEILGEAFTNRKDGVDADDVMGEAIQRANAAIYQMAHELPQLSNMATTVVALHLAGNIATIGHVGDSRLYRVDRDGKLFPETDDHSMVAEEVRAGRMTEEQAENHPSRNIISRALGAEPSVLVDIKTIMIEPGTAFLICSDGITRHVSDDEIKGVLTFGGAPAEVCDYLKSLCYERGAEDNLTAVVVRVSSDSAATRNGAGTFDSDAKPFAEVEETTLASARSPFESVAVNDDADELLELGVSGEEMPPLTPTTADDAEPEEELISLFDDEKVKTPEPEAALPAVMDFGAAPPAQADTFTMFGESKSAVYLDEKPSVLGKVGFAIGMLLIGGLLGLGFYHFFLAPPSSNTSNPPISEMKTANIPLSAFEENRRNVDKDPAGYIAKFGGDPQDSEDHYLLGRAYMLTGDYVKARTSFSEARSRLTDADPTNARVLADDIAIAIAVTNDTTIQTNLKKEFEAVRSTNSSAANSNR